MGANFGATEESSRAAAAYHRCQGVDGLVASLVSGPTERMVAEARIIAPLVADGTLLGIHLEGPFIAESCRGAHDPSVLRDPDPHLIEAVAEAMADVCDSHPILHVTFAPERAGARDFVATLGEARVVPALGHTASSAAEMASAIEWCLQVCGRPPIVTHLFNGMPAFHHRDGGAAAAAVAAAARGEAFVELIADGAHVAPDVVRMVFDAVGPERVILVSDAMAATGLGDGSYALGSLEVAVTDGVARLQAADGSLGSIAGSTATLADCVRWASEVAGVSAGDVLVAASVTPRIALGLDAAGAGESAGGGARDGAGMGPVAL